MWLNQPQTQEILNLLKQEREHILDKSVHHALRAEERKAVDALLVYHTMNLAINTCEQQQ